MIFRVLGCYIFVLFSVVAKAEVLHEAKPIKVLGVTEASHEGQRYFLELLDLLLSQPSIAGKYQLDLLETDSYTVYDKVHLVANKLIDITWIGATNAYADISQQVEVPVAAGLLGNRLLLIHERNGEKFRSINSVEELKGYVACQGENWPDSTILEHNQLLVERVSQYDSMLKMLNAGRCDYFPRGIHEAPIEIAKIKADYPKILMQGNILLHYDYPAHIYVHQENTELKNDLAAAFGQATKNGSFLALIKSHPFTSHVFPLAKWNNHRKLKLKNPLFERRSNPGNKILWLDLGAPQD